MTVAKLISKFVRIAKEGLTIDGRTISAKQIQDMAANYNPATYGARIWMEHFRGLMPDSMFPALGDVVELTTEKDSDGKLMLMAKLQPNDKLLAYNKADQKVFTSIEMDPDFAGTGEAYLVGLAVTDTPASLGTDRLMFNQTGMRQFADETHNKNQLWPAVDAGILDFSAPDDTAPENDGHNLFAKVREILGGKSAKDATRFTQIEASILELAKGIEGIATQCTELSARVADPTGDTGDDADAAAGDMNAKVAELTQQLSALTAQLNTQPDPNASQRPASTGADTFARTDC